MKRKLLLLALVAAVFTTACDTSGSSTAENPTEEISPESSEMETLPESEPETESIADASIASGIYDLNDITISFSDHVTDDSTGTWRLSRVTTAKDITEYAVDYYDMFFESDNEIHAVINPDLGTTAKLSIICPDLMDISILSYVTGEERNADSLFSGNLQDEYFLTISTGELENLLEEETESAPAEPSIQQQASASSAPLTTDEQVLSAAAPPATDEQTLSAAAPPATDSQALSAASPAEDVPLPDHDSAANAGNADNFNTYDNVSQQQTTASYVLNTNSLKIHYPSCRSVPKIKPENYSTSDLSVAELQAQGYTTCGNCFK
ncbi:MAG: hypothetical protein Q4C58_08355 [Eubacteriales bacterium]|nr:hypothetical protein [Eubacteriales bacterium]